MKQGSNNQMRGAQEVSCSLLRATRGEMSSAITSQSEIGDRACEMRGQEQQHVERFREVRKQANVQ